MRILLISHTYVVGENQKKVLSISEIGDVEVMLITPYMWREPVLRKIRAHVPADARFPSHRIQALGIGIEPFYFYLSPDLRMRRYKPDVLYVEQGAGAIVYTQSLIYRRLYAPKAKAVFFTWWNLPYRARWPLSAVERFNLRQSQGAVAGNRDAADILLDHGFTGPIAVLPQLGVDPDEYRRKDVTALRRNLGLDRLTIGYTGRFVEEKGMLVLLDALAGADFDFQLLLVGRGPLEPEIRRFAAHHGWGTRLKVVSNVGHSEISNYQNCMDIMVVPSLTRSFWKEQFGHVIIEAMACEVPVIGSDSGEVPRVIGDAGLITPESDARALRAALSLLAASPELRYTLGQAGRRRILANYTHQQIAQQLVGFFHSL